MSLDLSSFRKALDSLNRALVRWSTDPQDAELRDSVIQRFEYTFELSWKFLKRQIEAESDNRSEVDAYSKRRLFRVGGERGLIDNVEHWFLYIEQRNRTSHTYSEDTAGEVAAIAGEFARDAELLYRAIAGRPRD